MATLPPPPVLFVTTLLTGIILRSCQMRCINRPTASLPPPGALGTTISTGLVGFHSAAVTSAVTFRAATHSVPVMDKASKHRIMNFLD